MQVVSVSGTQIVVRIPDNLGVLCSATSGSFKVVLLESGLEADGGNFTIRGNSPTVLGVTPIIIPEADLGTPTADIVINGQFFAPDVLVQVGNYIAPSSDVTVESDSAIDVQNLPGIDELGITFNPTPCTLPGGAPGVRQASTPVAVTVTNFPGSCSDTLQGAIVIEPSATVCVASPANIVTNPSTQLDLPEHNGPGVFRQPEFDDYEHRRRRCNQPQPSSCHGHGFPIRERHVPADSPI